MLFEELKKAILFLQENLPNKTKNMLKEDKYENLDLYHFSLGLFVRTKLLNNSPLFHLLKLRGIENKDDMSRLILQLFYLHIRG